MFEEEKSRKIQDVWVSTVQSGDLKGLQNLLAEKGKREVNAPVGNLGLTLLHLCAIFDQVEIADWLLENKAKIDKKENISGKTPLHFAARYGHTALLGLLLDRSKKLSYSKRFSEDKVKCLPIHYGCMQKDLKVIELLVKHGNKPDAFANIGTPLDIAIRKKNLPLADFLSSNVGISCLQSPLLSPEFEDYLRIRDNLSPVHLAAITGEEEIAKMLLRKFPQFPSFYLKREWQLPHVLPILENEDLLQLLYSREEIPEVVEINKEYIKKIKSKFSSEIFNAIIDFDLDRTKKIVQEEGYEILTAKVVSSYFSPFELAEQICFFSFFDWLIEENVLPVLPFGASFCSRWYFMEIDQNVGGFFHLLPKELEILTRDTLNPLKRMSF